MFFQQWEYKEENRSREQVLTFTVALQSDEANALQLTLLSHTVVATVIVPSFGC